MATQRTVSEPGRERLALYDVDVAIAGAGLCSTFAAIASGRLGATQEVERVLDAGSHGLLAEHMLARLEGLAREGVVKVRGQRDHHPGHGPIGQERVHVGVGRAAPLLRRLGGQRLVPVAHGDQVTPGTLDPVQQMLRDDAAPQHTDAVHDDLSPELLHQAPALNLCSHTPAIVAQVWHAVDREWACTPADFLLRRTLLGLTPPCFGLDTVDTVAQEMGHRLGWPAEQVRQYVEAYRANVGDGSWLQVRGRVRS